MTWVSNRNETICAYIYQLIQQSFLMILVDIISSHF